MSATIGVFLLRVFGPSRLAPYPPPLSFDQNIAKRSCDGPFKLTPSYYINLIGVLCLFICYWSPTTAMDSVLATIVAGGQARFQ